MSYLTIEQLLKAVKKYVDRHTGELEEQYGPAKYQGIYIQNNDGSVSIASGITVDPTNGQLLILAEDE